MHIAKLIKHLLAVANFYGRSGGGMPKEKTTQPQLDTALLIAQCLHIIIGQNLWSFSSASGSGGDKSFCPIMQLINIR